MWLRARAYLPIRRQLRLVMRSVCCAVIGRSVAWPARSVPTIAVGLFRDHMGLASGPVCWRSEAHAIVSPARCADLVLANCSPPGFFRGKAGRLDHPERPGLPLSALPSVRAGGVRARRQDRPAAQGPVEDVVVVLRCERAGGVLLLGPGSPAAYEFGVVPDERVDQGD